MPTDMATVVPRVVGAFMFVVHLSVCWASMALPDFFAVFLKLGNEWVIPLILFACLAAGPFLLFWSIRAWFLPRVAFGTEIFALLFACDFMVATGLVEAWLLCGSAGGPMSVCTSPEKARWVYQWAATLTLPLLVLLSAMAIVWERNSEAEQDARDAEVRRYGAVLERGAWFDFDGWWSRVALLKWTLVTFHLIWIAKLTKLRLLVTL